MTLADLLSAGRLRRHTTSAQEVAELLRLAGRGLADARVEGISTDLRFSAAYDAIFALASIPLYCAGYRTTGLGHHVTAFEALPVIMGEELRELADYFDTCRVKRNIAHYQRSGTISGDEVEELITSTAAFQEQVEQWLQTNHPELVSGFA